MRYSKKQKMIDELREHVRNGEPFDLTFAPCGKLTKEERKILEDSLRDRFELWAETWVFPWIDMIEAKFVKRKTKNPK